MHIHRWVNHLSGSLKSVASRGCMPRSSGSTSSRRRKSTSSERRRGKEGKRKRGKEGIEYD
jgi:hypothetical protein